MDHRVVQWGNKAFALLGVEWEGGTGRIVRSSSMGNGRGGGRSVSVNIHGATICPQPFETSTHPIVTARDRIPHHLSAKRARTVDDYIP